MVYLRLTVMCALAACGGNPAGPDAAVPDAAVDANPFGSPSDTYPAYTIALPVAANAGGPTMSNVRIVPIYFADYAARTTLDDFYAKLAASPYWQQMVGEYGVTGSLTVAPSV